MPVCFIISPIGETGSETRRNADLFKDLIISPVLLRLGFTVIRGDHRSEAGQIDVDVIRAVQESDLCIVDLSLPNPNVYYELGRRDETGKPLILMKSKNSADLPVDIGTRRYIEYDLTSPASFSDTWTQLENFVKPIVEKGFESNGNGASLAEISEILRRVERKIERIGKEIGSGGGGGGTPIIPQDKLIDGNPIDAFNLAIRQKNIPMAETAMKALQVRMDTHRWIDQIVERAAAIGSATAGDILIGKAYDFLDNAKSFREKEEFLSCLVTNLNKTDREEEYVGFIEQLCEALIAIYDNEDESERIKVHNQLNRLYCGIYINTNAPEWLDKAVRELLKALDICEANFLHYNLAVCYNYSDDEDDKRKALKHIERCIEMDADTPDADHLAKACEIMRALGDDRLPDYLEELAEVNPVKAALLRDRWTQ